MDRDTTTQTTYRDYSSDTNKKGMSRRTRLLLIIFSSIFFLAAVIVPIVIFTRGTDKSVTEERNVGDFLMRYVLERDQNNNVVDEYYEIIRYTGSSKNVVIPATVGNVKVVSVLDGAFSSSSREFNKSIESITVAKDDRNDSYNLVSIGNSAFNGCEALSTFTIPDSVETVGAYAFTGSGIQNLVINDASVLKFDKNSLVDANSLTTVTIVGASSQINRDLNLNSDTIENVDVKAASVNFGGAALTGLTNFHTLSVYNISSDNFTIDASNFEDSNITTLNIYFAEEHLTKRFMEKFQAVGSYIEEINLAGGITYLDAGSLSYFTRLKKVAFTDNATVDISVLGAQTYNSQIFQYYHSTDTAFGGYDDVDGTDYVMRLMNLDNRNVLSSRFLNLFKTSQVKRVDLPENITEVDDNAFVRYINLTNLNFGRNSKIIRIGTDAFGSTDIDSQTVNISGLVVTGPVSVGNLDDESRVYTEFNTSSGRYAARYSYNGETTKGSYKVTVNLKVILEPVRPNVSFPTVEDIGTENNQRNGESFDVAYNASILNALKQKGFTQEALFKNTDARNINWHLDGWYLDEDYQTELTDDVLMTEEYSGGVVVYAKWSVLNNREFNVLYYYQTVDKSGYEQRGSVTVDSFAPNDYVDLMTVDAVSKVEPGYTIKTAAASSSDTQYSVLTGYNTIKNNNTHHFVIYFNRNEYSITFNDNVQEYSINPASFVDGTDLEKYNKIVFKSDITLPVMERAGYEFKGWTTTQNGQVVYTDTLSYSYTSNITLYAVWEAQTVEVRVEIQREIAQTEQGYEFSSGGGTLVFEDLFYADQLMSDVYNQIDSLRPDAVKGYKYYKAEVEENARVSGDKANNIIVVKYIKKLYSIKVNLNDHGSASHETANPYSPMTKTYKYLDSIGVWAEAERHGYKFNSWFYDSACTKQVGVDDQIGTNANLPENLSEFTIYAGWERENFVVAFSSNFGTPTVTDRTYGYDDEGTLPPSFTRSGYSFVGWSLSETGEVEYVFDGTKISYVDVNRLYEDYLLHKVDDKLNMYAQWKANKYNFRFHSNTESESTSNASIVLNETPLNMNIFERPGYNLVGYNSREDGTGVSIKTSEELYNYILTHLDEYAEAQLLSLYTEWEARDDTKYRINIKLQTLNPESYEDANAIIIQTGTTDTVVDSSDVLELISSNYGTYVNGFSYERMESNNQFKIAGDETLEINVYYQRRSIKVKVLVHEDSVNCVIVGLEGEHVTYDDVEDQYLVVFGSEYTITAVPVDGYVFDAWKVDSVTVGTTENLHFVVDGVDDITYVANVISKRWTVSYDGNGATEGEVASTYLTYNVIGNLAENAFVKHGYTFKGWSEDADSVFGVDDEHIYSNALAVETVNELYAITHGESLQLYAIWQANSFVITLTEKEDDVDAEATIDVLYDGSAVLPDSEEISDFIKHGYTLVAWKLSEETEFAPAYQLTVDEINALYDIYEESEEPKAVKLFARYEANSFALTYTAGTGVGANKTVVAYYDDNEFVLETAATANFAKTGYTFDKWTYNNGTTDVEVSGSGTTLVNGLYDYVTENNLSGLTLVANWTANHYIVKFVGVKAVLDDGSQTLSELTLLDDVLSDTEVQYHAATGTEDAYYYIECVYDQTLKLAKNYYKLGEEYNGESAYKFSAWRNRTTLLTYAAETEGLKNLTAEADGVVEFETVWQQGSTEYRFRAWLEQLDGSYVEVDINDENYLKYYTSYISGYFTTDETINNISVVTDQLVVPGFNYAGEYYTNQENNELKVTESTLLITLKYQRDVYSVVIDDQNGSIELETTDGLGVRLIDENQYEIKFGAILNASAEAKTGYLVRGYVVNGEVIPSSDTVYTITDEYNYGEATISLDVDPIEFVVEYFDGDNSLLSVDYSYDSGANLYIAPKVGYSFSGWKYTKGGSDLDIVYNALENAAFEVDRDIINELFARAGYDEETEKYVSKLYAGYEAIEYKVFFDPAEGSIRGEHQQTLVTVMYGEEYNISTYISEFYRKGYHIINFVAVNSNEGEIKFDSTNGDSLAEKAKTSNYTFINLTSISGATVTVSPVWEADTFAVVYKANQGSGADVEELWQY